MRKLVRTVKVTTLAAVLSLSFTAISYADQWEQDAHGYRCKVYGDYVWGGDYWIDGNGDGIAECYYFDENGYMLSNTTAPNGKKLNENGAWVLNGVVQTQNPEERALYDEAEEAYKDYIGGLDESEEVKYNLVYLNDDAIPELVYATGNYHAAGVYICTYRDGRVYPLSSHAYGGYGSMTYLPKKGLVWTVDMHMGYETGIIYRMQGLEVQELCFASYNVDTENEAASAYDEFRLNGRASTKAEVLNYQKQLTDGLDQAEFSYDLGFEYHGEWM